MYKYLYVIIVCLLLTSCASIFNSDNTSVFLYTETPTTIYHNFDTLLTEFDNGYNIARLNIPRSKKTLYLAVENDSLTQKIILPSKKSKTYKLNYIFPYLFLMEFTSGDERRYTYDTPILLDKKFNLYKNTSDSLFSDMKQRDKIAKLNEYDKFDTYKGNIYLNLSFPPFYPGKSNLKFEKTPRISKVAVFGMAIGFDYYYNKNKFINLTGSLITGGSIGCTAPYSDDDRYYSLNMHISHNHRYKRISLGYGLSYSFIDRNKDEYIWNELMAIGHDTRGYIYDKDYSPAHKSQQWKFSGVGTVFNTYFYFSPNFYAGIIYMPTFVRLKTQSGSPFFYQHQISFDFSFKIKLLSGK